MRVENKVILNSHQYCVVLDPLGSDGKPQLGTRELRKGCNAFFLHPGQFLLSTSFVTC